MSSDHDLPEHLKKAFRHSLLEQAKSDDCLGIFELSLFQWYVSENTALIDRMLADERAYLKEQQDHGMDDLNDSGIVAVEYYTKRIRYADVIYMCSLLETFLSRACDKLTMILGKKNVLFTPGELSGDKWHRYKKFLERFGDLTVPDQLWSRLLTVKSVRNFIVHENGSTTSIPEGMKERIAKFPGVSIDGHEIVLESSFVHTAFSAFSEFVGCVNSQLLKLIDSGHVQI
jgi:hypothetical protein